MLSSTMKILLYKIVFLSLWHQILKQKTGFLATVLSKRREKEKDDKNLKLIVIQIFFALETTIMDM